MSFILDALKKSERERQQTAAPNDAYPAGDGRPGRRRLWIWIAGAALSLIALGGAAFFLLPSGGQPTVEISLPPAAPEAEEQRPAQAAPPAPPPAAKARTGTEVEWAMLTKQPAGSQTAPPAGPPPPPVLTKDPEPAPPPEPAQPAAPAPSAPPEPKPETARNMAAAKPRPFAKPGPVQPAPPPEAAQDPEPVQADEVKQAPSPPPARAPEAPAPVQVTTAAAESREGDPSAYTRRGQAFEREGLYDRAIEEYTRAILIDPAFTDAYLGRGWAHMAKGNTGQAIRNFGEAIGLDSSLAEAPFARGWAYEQLGQRDRAIEDYGAAIRIAPDHGDARFSRGILRFYAGQPEPAAGDFSAILETSCGALQTYALLWLYLSRARAGGDPDRELQAHGGELDLEPWPGIIVKLYLGQVPAARVIAETRDGDPVKQRENESVAYFFLGQERLVKGDTERAAEYFQMTLDTGITGYRQYAAAEEELRLLGRLN